MPERPIEEAVATLRQLAADAVAGTRTILDTDLADGQVDAARAARTRLLAEVVHAALDDTVMPALTAVTSTLAQQEQKLEWIGRQCAQISPATDAVARIEAGIAQSELRLAKKMDQNLKQVEASLIARIDAIAAAANEPSGRLNITFFALAIGVVAGFVSSVLLAPYWTQIRTLAGL